MVFGFITMASVSGRRRRRRRRQPRSRLERSTSQAEEAAAAATAKKQAREAKKEEEAAKKTDAIVRVKARALWTRFFSGVMKLNTIADVILEFKPKRKRKKSS